MKNGTKWQILLLMSFGGVFFKKIAIRHVNQKWETHRDRSSDVIDLGYIPVQMSREKQRPMTIKWLHTYWCYDPYNWWFDPVALPFRFLPNFSNRYGGYVHKSYNFEDRNILYGILTQFDIHKKYKNIFVKIYHFFIIL